MTTIEIDTHSNPASEARARPTPVWPLISILWSSWRRHRADRATLIRLQALDERTLADMGFEPAEIYGLRAGTVAEVHGDAWKGLRR